MRILIWLIGLIGLLGSCKHEVPQPKSTIIQGATKDQQGVAVSQIEVWIIGSKGSYFGGTRKDTIFAKLATDSKGMLVYEQIIPDEWRVYFSPNGYPNYDVVRFEGTVDGIVNVGQTNNITAILRKR